MLVAVGKSDKYDARYFKYFIIEFS